MSTGDAQAVTRVVRFTARMLQDALADATADFWERRARTFEAAAPRQGDFNGRATTEDLEARRARCELSARVCRQRASLERHGQPVDPDVWAVLAERIAS